MDFVTCRFVTKCGSLGSFWLDCEVCIDLHKRRGDGKSEEDAKVRGSKANAQPKGSEAVRTDY